MRLTEQLRRIGARRDQVLVARPVYVCPGQYPQVHRYENSVGQMGESFGVLLFGSADDFGAFLDTADQAIANEMPDGATPHGAELRAPLGLGG